MDINNQLVEIIVNAHAFFGDAQKVSAWMNFRSLVFGGASPIELINAGKGDKVLDFVIQQCEQEGAE